MRFALEALLADVPAEQVAEARAFYRSRVAGRGPASFEELKEARAKKPAPRATVPPAVEETVEAAGVRVPVRIFLPAEGPPRAVYLGIHGGGFYMGSAAQGDERHRELADALRIAVVSVDYRLAPEHPGRPRPTTAKRRRSGSSRRPRPVSGPPGSRSAEARPGPPSPWRPCSGCGTGVSSTGSPGPRSASVRGT